MPHATGLVYDARYLDHDPGEFLIRYTKKYEYDEVEPHPSGPVVTRRTFKLLKTLGYLDALTRIAPRLGTAEDIELVHDPSMREHIEQVSLTGGDAGTGAPIIAGGEETARLAIGGSLEAVDCVMSGGVRNAFGLIRPPGHHATRNESLGFCVYNNIAIAARYAQETHGCKRIAIIDWDVHHGNGTQDIFWDDDSVLFISLHQDNLFPLDWGKVEDVGEGDARGTTVNIPLPAGSGNAVYLAAMKEIVRPIIEQFAPDMIMISAGQDASIQDPLGRMIVTVPAYREMTLMFRDLANSICDGRLIVLQEGGYSNYYAPYCAAAIVEGLMSDPPRRVDDPFSPRSEAQRYTNEVGLDQRAALDAVIATQKEWWQL